MKNLIYKGMRSILCLALVSFASASFASFDLMLLGDNTVASAGRVVRYDPVNQVVLGSFGSSYINGSVVSIATDPTRNRVFVTTNTSTVSIFNYNSGEYLGGYGIAGAYFQIAYDPTSQILFTGHGEGSGTSPGRGYTDAGVNTINNAGVYSSTAAIRHPIHGFRTAWVMDSIPNVRAGSFALAGGASLALSSVMFAWTGGEGFRASTYSSAGRFVGLNLRAGQLELWGTTYNADGTSATPTLDRSFGASTNSNADLVNGHGSLMYVLNGNQILNYNSASDLVLGAQTLNFASAANIRGMAIVLAPEPGGFLGLGAAWLFLARRRRSPSGSR